MGQCFSIASKIAKAVAEPTAPSSAAPTGGAQGRPNPTTTITDAYVVKMPDGDTITVTYTDPITREEAKTRVRIFAIDCPESAQNFGPEATKIGQSVLLHKTVTLHPHTTDRYGRLVADVVTDAGVNYSEFMLRKGAAWHYKAYDKSPHLADLELQARNSHTGLWSFARPQPPWDYRARRRNANKK